MKISDLYSQSNRMQYVNQANASNPQEKPQTPKDLKENLPLKDRVDLSTRSKEMQKVVDALQATPDVRGEKVAHYKKLIEDGNYQVASEDLADKMLKESLLDLL